MSPSEPSTPAASCADASSLAETSVSRDATTPASAAGVPPGFGEHLLGAAEHLPAVLAEVAERGADVRPIAAFDRRRLGVADGAGGIEERGDVVAVAGGDDVQRPVGERRLAQLAQRGGRVTILGRPPVLDQLVAGGDELRRRGRVQLAKRRHIDGLAAPRRVMLADPPRRPPLRSVLMSDPERVALPPLPPALAALREHVLKHSVKRGQFTLKSGATSTWFLDTKQTACRPDGIVLVADAVLSILPDSATAIGGLTMGADPVAFGVAAVAATRGRALRSFSVRKEAKDHGVTGRIAGALEPGDGVVITEDTVTRGTSLMEAVEVVREFGAEPVLITVIVDRGGTCAAMAADAGVAYRPLLTAPDLGFAFGT